MLLCVPLLPAPQRAWKKAKACPCCDAGALLGICYAFLCQPMLYAARADFCPVARKRCGRVSTVDHSCSLQVYCDVQIRFRSRWAYWPTSKNKIEDGGQSVCLGDPQTCAIQSCASVSSWHPVVAETSVACNSLSTRGAVARPRLDKVMAYWVPGQVQCALQRGSRETLTLTLPVRQVSKRDLCASFVLSPGCFGLPGARARASK